MPRKADPYNQLSPEQREEVRRRVLVDLLEGLRNGGGVGRYGPIAASSAAIRGISSATEVLYLLPAEFVLAYEELFEKALKLDGGSALGSASAKVGTEGEAQLANPIVPVASSGGMTKKGTEKGLTAGDTGNRRGQQKAAGGGKRYKTYATVLNEQALKRKQFVDSKLRELVGIMASPGPIVLDRCTSQSCRRFMESGWRYCPTCGTRSK